MAIITMAQIDHLALVDIGHEGFPFGVQCPQQPRLPGSSPGQAVAIAAIWARALRVRERKRGAKRPTMATKRSASRTSGSGGERA
ncbi:MAG TPA: hypothetical protein VND19_16270, partial [Acetobacteraceae bacterium]|nr:hypothetical protein [Acetobacteraceae bacterium]